jgi:hypothetical protein
LNRIGGVMVSLLASSTVDHGFKPLSGQTKDYKIGICCFSAKHEALRRKSKDLLAQNQDNLSVSYHNKKKACWSSTKQTSSSFHWKLTCSRHDIAEKLLGWCNNHSLTPLEWMINQSAKAFISLDVKLCTWLADTINVSP